MNPFSAPPMNLGKRWKVSIGADLPTCGSAIDEIPSYLFGDEQKQNLKKLILDPNTTSLVLQGYSNSMRPFAPGVSDCLDSIIHEKDRVFEVPPATPPENVPPTNGSAASSSSAVPIVLGVVGAGAAIYLLTRKH